MLKYRRSNGGKRNEEKEILRSASKSPQIENTLMNSITKHALCIATVSLLQLNANAVIVTADPVWTDSGISLKGEHVCITAQGEWSWGGGSLTGPDGDNVGAGLAWDEWVPNGYHGQLIAFVGANPFSGSSFYSIGSSGDLSGLTGELWLGFNDDRLSLATGDNYGRVEATIANCPDGGSSLALLGAAVTAVGAMRRRFNR